MPGANSTISKIRFTRTFDGLSFCQRATPVSAQRTGNAGCLGFLFTTFLGGLSGYSKKKGSEMKNIPKLRLDADDILGRPDIKEKLCEILGPSTRLPIDVAHTAVPFLYEFAGEHEEELPRDSMLFAIICTKIAEDGVAEYCR